MTWQSTRFGHGCRPWVFRDGTTGLVSPAYGFTGKSIQTTSIQSISDYLLRTPAYATEVPLQVDWHHEVLGFVFIRSTFYEFR